MVMVLNMFKASYHEVKNPIKKRDLGKLQKQKNLVRKNEIQCLVHQNYICFLAAIILPRTHT